MDRRPGGLPEREWRDPVNVSFAGPPITYDQAAAAAKTTTTTTKTTYHDDQVGSGAEPASPTPRRRRTCTS